MHVHTGMNNSHPTNFHNQVRMQHAPTMWPCQMWTDAISSATQFFNPSKIDTNGPKISPNAQEKKNFTGK